MNLPIDVVAGTNPPVFRWKQVVNTLAGSGTKLQACEGKLPASVEGAVANLIAYAKQLERENKELWERLEDTVKAGAPPAPPVVAKGRR